MLHPTPPKQAPPVDGRRALPRSVIAHAGTAEMPCVQGLPSSSRQQVPTAAASPAGLPAINNRILLHHSEQFQALQQQVLQDYMMATQEPHACADSISEDDTQLPEARYAHMSDALLPERDPASFEAWRADMQLRLQQHLSASHRQQLQQPAAALGQHATPQRQQ